MRRASADNATEAQLHRQIAGFLRTCLLPPTWFSTFPAGGGGELRGKILHGRGLRAGVPDILIIHRGVAHWLELKTASGRLSDVQDRCHAELWDAGCAVAVCRSLEEVKAQLEVWLIPLRKVSLSSERLIRAVSAPAVNPGEDTWPKHSL